MTDQPEQHEHPLAHTDEYKQLNAIGRRNGRRMQELAQQGIQLKDDSIAQQRLELLIEFLLPANTHERIQYELLFAQKIERSLDAAEAELNRAKLLGRKPGQQGPSLIVPR